jgi:hypothetical protein
LIALKAEALFPKPSAKGGVLHFRPLPLLLWREQGVSVSRADILLLAGRPGISKQR